MIFKSRVNKKLLFLAAFLLVFPSFLQAAGEGTSGDYAKDISVKFGRGLWNVVSSPAEIPCGIRDEVSARGVAAGSFTGLGMGTVYMLRRILVGATEVGTFVIPMEATIPPVCKKAEPAVS